MKVNKCMHNAFHDRPSEFAQVHNTTILNSQSSKMIVSQELVKYELFLPGSCLRG
jgi:hypothetical protein